MATLQEDVKVAGIANPKGCHVQLRVVGDEGAPIEAWTDDAITVPIWPLDVSVAADGTWSQVVPNIAVPSGAKWQRLIIQNGKLVGDQYLDVPQDTGTYNVADLLYPTPGGVLEAAEQAYIEARLADIVLTPGADGKTVRSGAGAPSAGLGVDGDFYINTTAKTIYGPKTAGAWGAATSLIGPTGPTGPVSGGSLRRTGAVAVTYPRHGAAISNIAVLNSGRLSLVAIELIAGQVISTITFASGSTAAGTPTHQWFSLWSAVRAKLRVTSDDTNTAWAATSEKTLTLSSPYTVPADGLYYLGILVTATTVPTLIGTSSNAIANGYAPTLNGFADTGLTDPASAPPNAAAITNAANSPWAWVA